MKILHTADLHIREYDDVRWQTLQKIVQLGKSQEIDVMVISGDLFESSADAHKLRPKIREIFSGINWPVLVIPGNHDAEAFPDGAFFGEKITVIRHLLSPVEIDGVYFWGFPYEELLEEEILEYLSFASGRAAKDAVHILIFHGELLDITGGWNQYGEEGNQRYLPVKLSYFQELPWRYVLAGHFHSNFGVHEFGKDGYFVYPGSPVSITRSELGPRKVNLFEIGQPPTAQVLDSFYYERAEIHLDPFQEESPLFLISEKLQKMPENAQLLLEISGFFNGKNLGMTEQELHRAISKLSGQRVELAKLEFQDIREILEDDIFKSFMDRLGKRQLDAVEKKRILEITLKAMMESQA
jgi:DNA repair exonuclease SbcCD nuclease subunit